MLSTEEHLDRWEAAVAFFELVRVPLVRGVDVGVLYPKGTKTFGNLKM